MRTCSSNFEDILRKFGEIMGKYRILDENMWGLKDHHYHSPFRRKKQEPLYLMHMVLPSRGIDIKSKTHATDFILWNNLKIISSKFRI